MAAQRGRIAPFDHLEALRRARREDYDLVYQSGAMLRAEELDEDPRVSDPFGYAKRVEEECRDGYTHLWVDDEGLCFRARRQRPHPGGRSGVRVFTLRRRGEIADSRAGGSPSCARACSSAVRRYACSSTISTLRPSRSIEDWDSRRGRLGHRRSTKAWQSPG